MSERFGMRTRAALTSAFLFSFLTTFFFLPQSRAASPENLSDTGLTTFRVTAGEVHVAISAVESRSEAAGELSASDFILLRDGRPVEQIVSFRRCAQMPVSALVLTDVSESMRPGLKLERDAAQWLKANSDTDRDHLRFLDFGMEVGPTEKRVGTHLTSLYDSLLMTLAEVTSEGAGRRALILMSDGDDNSSYHGLEDVITIAQKFDVAIYAITAHPSRKQYVAEDILQTLTAETGGRFFQVRNTRQMEEALSAIRAELTNGYELVFRSNSMQPGMHQLAIKPMSAKLRFFYRTAYFQPDGVAMAAR